MSKSNYFWIAILIASLFVAFFFFKTAYANPLGLPDYAFTSQDIKEAYTFAKTNGDKLLDLPCNCGCAKLGTGHDRLHSRGLIDCFMNGDVNNGGAWDRHASECGLCYEDALYSKSLYEQGKSKEEVRQGLEAKYSSQKWSNETVY